MNSNILNFNLDKIKIPKYVSNRPYPLNLPNCPYGDRMGRQGERSSRAFGAFKYIKVKLNCERSELAESNSAVGNYYK
jgi:hypothetical protein